MVSFFVLQICEALHNLYMDINLQIGLLNLIVRYKYFFNTSTTYNLLLSGYAKKASCSLKNIWPYFFEQRVKKNKVYDLLSLQISLIVNKRKDETFVNIIYIT